MLTPRPRLFRLSFLIATLPSVGSSIELNEWAGEIGYRQDHSCFQIQAVLADNASSGIGKMDYHSVQIGEIDLQGELGLTPRFIGRGELKFGYVFHGQMDDSGIADITANPCNAYTAQYYGLCCSCPESIDDPFCVDKPLVATVPAMSNVRGTTWDLTLGIGAVFNPDEAWKIVPLVGWEFNQQRYRWKDSVWGPIALEHIGILCAESSVDSSLHTTPCCAAFLYGPECAPCCDADQYPFNCIGFGECFDQTVYRARWNTGFLGLEFNWDPAERWHLSLSYALHFGLYSGLFDTTDSVSSGCNCCPTCTPDCGSSLVEPEQEGFAPTQLTVSSNAFGQELLAAADWNAGGRIHWGIQAGWNSRRATSCADVEPCASCVTVCDPLHSGRFNPIWKNAILERARWVSWDILLTVGMAF